jgi:hypothetical protein
MIASTMALFLFRTFETKYQTMKKIILSSLALLVLVCNSSFSQIQVAFGAKGGLNFSSLNSVTSPATLQAAYGNRTGYHIGAYALVKVTKFAIQPEIIFSSQGQNFVVPATPTNFTSTFNYINIPVMLKFYLLGGLNLQAGPQFSFLTSARGDIINTINGQFGNSTASADLSNFVKATDFSLSFGAGWDLPLGLNITARYNLGLTDINQLSGGTIPSFGSISSLGTAQAKSQVVQVSIGYRLFKLGK